MSFPIDNMLASYPIPAFSSAEEVAKLTICGETYAISFSAVDTSVIQPDQVFTIFNKLPRELKTKILGFAAGARIIHAIEVPRANQGSTPTAQAASAGAIVSQAFTFIGAHIPHIFQVSKEVMGLAGGMGYRAMFEVHGNSKKVYFNPYIDTLHLQTSYTRINLLNQVELSRALVDPSEVALVQYLRVPYQAFNLHLDNVVLDIGSMTKLKILTLSGKFDVFPTQPDFTLKLNFEKSEEEGIDGGAIVVAEIPGNRLEGFDATDAVQYWVPHAGAFQYITGIYEKVYHAMEDELIPDLVKLELRLAAALLA